MLLSFFAAPSPAYTANPSPVQIFYVTLPEDPQADTVFKAISNVTTQPYYTYVSIAIGSNSTLVYYDQGENGYDSNIANPANLYSAGNPGGTQIWGDGNTANGAPPGFPGDVLNAGNVIILNNAVPYPRGSAILFDGKDKVGASQSISMARAAWPSNPGTLLAFAHEMYSTAEWGTAYESPVGTNTVSSEMFQYSALSIMASQTGTVVEIDANADGTYESTQTLNEGGSYLATSILQGARVRTTDSTKPIQVVLLTGDIASPTGYEARDMNLLPTSAYGSSYWSPVGVDTSSSGPTRLFLYNPSSNGSIYIRCLRRTSGNTTLGPIAARGVVTLDLANNEAAHCFASLSNGTATTDPIFGIGIVDACTGTNSGSCGAVYDWSFTLFPDNFLSTDALVGLGLPDDPISDPPPPTENSSPLWVTAACASGSTYVYVDWNNDGTADLVDLNGDGDTGDSVDGISEGTSNNGILVALLQSVPLRQPTQAGGYRTQTGARVWSRTAANIPLRANGTPGCNLALAWGQDPRNASQASPGLDVGTSIPPLRLIEGTKGLALKTDIDGDGQLSPGDIATYNITVKNTGSIPVSNVYVYDTVPVNTSYVTSTTQKDIGSGWVSIPDDGSGTPFPLDVLPNGVPVGGPLNPGATFYIRFDITLNALTLGVYDEIANCDVANAGGLSMLSCTTNQVASRDWGDLPDTYGTSAAQNGPRHSAGSLRLGSDFDRELQGQPSTDALGDDNTGLDDEDGVILASYDQLGQTLTLDVTCTSSPTGPSTGWLVVWFDWNENDTFASNEASINQLVSCSTAGTKTTITTSFSGFEPNELYYRVRLFETQPANSSTAFQGPAVNGEVEDYFYAVPTALTASSPVATAVDNSIHVNWQTYSEVDILGFNLYRATALDGARTLVYQTPALHQGSLLGDDYEYIDGNVQLGVTYTYWLEVLLKDGSTVTLEPTTTSLLGANIKIFLPMIRR